jgi:hypothetical protein
VALFDLAELKDMTVGTLFVAILPMKARANNAISFSQAFWW